MFNTLVRRFDTPRIDGLPELQKVTDFEAGIADDEFETHPAMQSAIYLGSFINSLLPSGRGTQIVSWQDPATKVDAASYAAIGENISIQINPHTHRDYGSTVISATAANSRKSVTYEFANVRNNHDNPEVRVWVAGYPLHGKYEKLMGSTSLEAAAPRIGLVVAKLAAQVG